MREEGGGGLVAYGINGKGVYRGWTTRAAINLSFSVDNLPTARKYGAPGSFVPQARPFYASSSGVGTLMKWGLSGNSLGCYGRAKRKKSRQ